MPELRFNILTNEWVIVSPERSKRPLEFKPHKHPHSTEQHDPTCPFCPGNEHLTSQETYRLENNNTWLTRSVMNKFPALSAERNPTPSGSFTNFSIDGFGIHEVIIDSPRHDLTLSTFSHQQTVHLLNTYLQRYKACEQDPRVVHIIIFKNHGEMAGSSLIHPHSQLIAVPIVSNQIDERLKITRDYIKHNGKCLVCTMIQNEINLNERIIYKTKHFIALLPYAALSCYHTWIMPLTHNAKFSGVTPEALHDLATIILLVIKSHELLLNAPDYNLVIRSAPSACPEELYHWYISVIPRITKTAGFEIGSGIYINTSLPEDNAKKLHEIADMLSKDLLLEAELSNKTHD